MIYQVKNWARPLSVLGIIFALVGCTENGDKDGFRPHVRPAMTTDQQREYDRPGRLFGGPIISFSTNRKKKEESFQSGIGVNTHLWRATLETLSFMPLKTVEPFGGVILTDWYVPTQTPRERLKVNVLILDRQLRADGLKVTIFHQKYDEAKKEWVDLEVTPETVNSVEESILTRARELRIQSKIK